MKTLTLIVHAETEQPLADMLRSLMQVSGFTFTHVEGHGAQDERDPQLSARDRVVGFTPHVRVDILLKGEDVDAVLRTLRTAGGGFAGRGVYWVADVVQQGRL